jgi:hypothetical protein
MAVSTSSSPLVNRATPRPRPRLGAAARAAAPLFPESFIIQAGPIKKAKFIFTRDKEAF